MRLKRSGSVPQCAGPALQSPGAVVREVAGGTAGVRKKHDGRVVLECNKENQNGIAGQSYEKEGSFGGEPRP